MEVRIETTSEEATTVVKVTGRLAGAGVQELQRICHAVSGGLVLDLSDLVSTDEEGEEAIRALTRSEAEVRGASPYLRLLLESDSS